MLGNFSFGQYYKEGAIELAREFVQEHMKLDWDRVWVTVHAGDPQMKLGPDEEAIELWQRVGMPSERIVPLPTSENFWSWAAPDHAGPTRSSTGTGARSTAAASPTAHLPARAVTGFSSSGTSCSWRTNSTPTAC